MLALVIRPLTMHPFRDGAQIVSTPNRDTSNVLALILCFTYVTLEANQYVILFLFSLL